MKKLIYLISVVAFLTSHWSCDDTVMDPITIENEKVIIHKSKLQNKEFESKSLMNNVIGNDPIRKMQVYTPPGYDHKRAEGYPVVYLLHGEPFSEKAFTDLRVWDEFIGANSIFNPNRDFPEEGFRLWVDNLIETGKMEPMIIVTPNAVTYPYAFSLYSNSILNGNF